MQDRGAALDNVHQRVLAEVQDAVQDAVQQVPSAAARQALAALRPSPTATHLLGAAETAASIALRALSVIGAAVGAWGGS